MSSKTVVRLLVLHLFSAVCGLAQVQTGMQSHGSFISKGADTINAGNDNIMLTIPVLNKQGRGLPLTYNLTFNSSIWYPTVSGTTTMWEPVTTEGSYWGWQGLQPAGQSGIFYSTSYFQGTCYNGSPVHYQQWTITPGKYIDEVGGIHPLTGGPLTYYDSPGGQSCPPSGWLPQGAAALNTNDGSGYKGTMSPNGTQAAIFTLSDARGRKIDPPAYLQNAGSQGNLVETDANGNTISVNNGAYTDTTGTVGLTVTGSAPASTVLRYNLPNNGSASYTVSYKQYTVATNFHCNYVTDHGPMSASLIDRVTLPDNSFYQFSYEPTAGMQGDVTARVASVTLPTGGTISYNYYGGTNGISCEDGATPGFSRTTNDGVSTYNRGGVSANLYTTTVTDERGNQTFYHFSVDSQRNFYETHRQAYQGAVGGTPLQEVYNCYNGADAPCDSGSVYSPITEVYNVSNFNGGIQLYAYTNYDSAGVVVTSQSQHDAKNLLQSVANTYNIYGSLYELTSTKTMDGSGNTVASTTYGYDETSLSLTSGLPQHAGVSGPRGNQTSVHVSIDGTPTSTLTTTTAYYDTGMPVSSTAPGGFTTTYGYDTTGTFQTATNLPTPSSGVGLSTSAAYDAASGALLSATGLNSGQTYSITGYDGLLRPTAGATSENGQSTVAYTPNRISARTEQNSSQWADTETFLDGYGRTVRTAVQSSSGWYVTDFCYSQGVLQAQSVPYVSASAAPGSTNCASSNATQYSLDALGRTTYTASPDGHSMTYQYGGRAIKVSDSNGPAKILQYDLLGRPSGICELISASIVIAGGDSGSNCGQYSNPVVSFDLGGTGVTTAYVYDMAHHKATVYQGSQTRSFQTDAASRPTSVTEPESGTTNYSYAYNSTGLQTMRSRPSANQTNPNTITTTTTQMDSIGRIVAVNYTDGTHTKTFMYDVPSISSAGANKGSLTSIANVIAGTSYAYDSMGRVSQTSECLPDWCGQIAHSIWRYYGYDLASELTYEAWASQGNQGSPFSVSYSYNSAGQMTSLIDGQNNAVNAPNIYTATSSTMQPGGPASVSFGNNTNATITYDNMARLQGSWFCGQPGGAGCPNSTYLYGFGKTQVGDQVKFFADGWTNPGLFRQTNYSYDQLGNLAGSSPVPNGSYPALNFSATYDRYGNRWSEVVTNTPSGTGPNVSQTYNTSNNQLVGYVYDAVGNLINDKVHTYQYDAENNLVSIDNGSTATYTYNALNHRVKVATPAGVERYGFDLKGRRATTWTDDSVSTTQYYTDRGPVAFFSTADNLIHFQYGDHLGTDHVRTDNAGNGQVVFDSLPFGEPNYTSGGADLNPGHYAGLEQDGSFSASSLGLHHATFREYNSTLGRWMSPDPYSGSYDSGDPQSMNRYSYVRNNPLLYIDPDGTSGQGPCYYTTCTGSTHGGSGSLTDYFIADLGAIESGSAPAELSYDRSGSPFVYQVTGTLFGKPVDQTFESWAGYADWETSQAALPENVAYAAYMLGCSYANTSCTGDDTVKTTYRGTTPNFQIALHTIDTSSMNGYMRDPLTSFHQGQPSWYNWSPISTQHIATLNGLIEVHHDSFGPLLLPLHFFVDVLPSYWINPGLGTQGPTYICSPLGGCR